MRTVYTRLYSNPIHERTLFVLARCVAFAVYLCVTVSYLVIYRFGVVCACAWARANVCVWHLRAVHPTSALCELVRPVPHLLFVSDHGMNERGNHGGADEGEVSSLLVFISPRYKNGRAARYAPDTTHNTCRATLTHNTDATDTT